MFRERTANARYPSAMIAHIDSSADLHALLVKMASSSGSFDA